MLKRDTLSVKFFSAKKCFGFLHSDDGDVFLHGNQIRDSGLSRLLPGWEVDCVYKRDDAGRCKVVHVDVIHPKPIVICNEPRPTRTSASAGRDTVSQ